MFFSIWVLLLCLTKKTVFGSCISNSSTTVKGTRAPLGEICSGDLVFQENFDTFSLHIWRHDITIGGGASNNQFQVYVNNRTNTYVQNGILHIKPTLLADEQGEPFLSSGTMDMNSWYPNLVCTNAQFDGCKRTGNAANILTPIKSAKINTVKSFSFKYGKVEINAKIPSGEWLWPAMFLMPRYGKYGSWPASGEIDIMGSRGNKQLVKNGVNIGAQQVDSNLHWGPNTKNDKYTLTDYPSNNANGFNLEFHKYQVLWTPDNFTFSIDDVQTGFFSPPEGGFWQAGGFNTSTLDNPWKSGTKMAPFDSEFFIVIQLAVGSTTYFSDSAVNSPDPKPWNNTDGSAAPVKFWNAKNSWLSTWDVTTDNCHLQIDYVKVWAL